MKKNNIREIEKVKIKSEKYAKEKGITLVALIITIIILLILAAITVDVAIDGKLFDKAEKAVKDTNEKTLQQQNRVDELMGKLDDIEENMKEARNWITVFEGEENSNNGEIIIMDPYLLEENTYYKFTVESDEYTGTVELKTILYDEAEGEKMYALFAVEDGKVTTFNSKNEIENKMNSIEGGTFVLGVNAVGRGTIFFFQNDGCEYTITKIEKEFKESKKIYEGEFQVQRGAELPVQLDLTKKYRIIVEYNGETIPYTAAITGLIFNVPGIIVVNQGQVLFNIKDNCIRDCIEGISIKEIYELEGNAEYYIEENGFGIIYLSEDHNDSEWVLVKTPKTDYTIPNTIKGIEVDMVSVDSITGNPTFDRPVKLIYLDLGIWSAKNIKVTTQDYEFIFENSYDAYETTLDLSECGDNIQIPSRYLDDENDFSVIYVSPAVKAKYAEYDKIVAK